MRAGWSLSFAAFDRVEYLVGRASGCAVGVGRIHDDVFGGDAQLLFDSLGQVRPRLFAKHARIGGDQGRARVSVIDHDRPRVDAVEDSLDIFRQLSGRDIDFGGAGLEGVCCGLRECAPWNHGGQNQPEATIRCILISNSIVIGIVRLYGPRLRCPDHFSTAQLPYCACFGSPDPVPGIRWNPALPGAPWPGYTSS